MPQITKRVTKHCAASINQIISDQSGRKRNKKLRNQKSEQWIFPCTFIVIGVFCTKKKPLINPSICLFMAVATSSVDNVWTPEPGNNAMYVKHLIRQVHLSTVIFPKTWNVLCHHRPVCSRLLNKTWDSKKCKGRSLQNLAKSESPRWSKSSRM